jgi:hypothetical protein
MRPGRQTPNLRGGAAPAAIAITDCNRSTWRNSRVLQKEGVSGNVRGDVISTARIRTRGRERGRWT